MLQNVCGHVSCLSLFALCSDNLDISPRQESGSTLREFVSVSLSIGYGEVELVAVGDAKIWAQQVRCQARASVMDGGPEAEPPSVLVRVATWDLME